MNKKMNTFLLDCGEGNGTKVININGEYSYVGENCILTNNDGDIICKIPVKRIIFVQTFISVENDKSMI